jgi:hypothetical protein
VQKNVVLCFYNKILLLPLYQHTTKGNYLTQQKIKIMTTIANYGENKLSIFNAAIDAIANGGSFNGTVYCKFRNKNSTNISVYVSGNHFCLGDVWPKDANKIKEEFIDAVAALTNKKISKDETKIFGTEAWLFSCMNAE